MPRKLSDESLGEPISPLIDVVMNAFAAMFIILIIFISVFHRRDETPPPRFMEAEPPPLIRGQNYIFTLPVSGGIGQRSFTIAKGNLSALGMSFETNTGTIFGLANLTTEDTTLAFPLTAECEFGVTDAAGRTDTRVVRFRMSSSAVPFPDTKFSITRQSKTLPGARRGSVYEAVLGASGGVEPYGWKLLSGKLPDGIILDSTGGRLFGEPTETGNFAFTIEAEQLPGTFVANGVHYNWSAGKSAMRYEMAVHDAFKASLNLPVGRVGEPYIGSLNSNGRLPGERLSWTAQVPGLLFSDEDGGVSGVPGQEGIFTVGYRISGAPDGRGEGEQKLQIVPALPSREAGAITIQAWVGTQTDTLIPYRGMKEPVTITNLAPLPAGLALEGTRLTGTPRQAGHFSMPIAIRDLSGVEINGSVSIFIHPSKQPIKLSEPIVVPLVIGVPVAWRPPTRGGESRLSWALQGEMPSGLSMSNEVLVGTIRSKGEWTGTVTARDDVMGSSVTQKIEFRGVLPEETKPFLATTAIPQAFVGVPFDFVFAAEGGLGVPRFSFTGDLPPGLSFKTNGIQGTPQAAGDWRISATVEDAVGQRDTAKQFLISARYGDQSLPVLLTSTIPPALLGTPYEFVFSVGGGVGMPSFAFSGDLPKGLKFTASGISGTAQEVRDGTVEVSAVDQAGRRTQTSRFAIHALPSDITKPEVVTTSLHAAIRGEQYLHELAGEGGIGRYRWSVGGEMPPGLKLVSHRVEGIVSQEARLGVWNLKFTVHDEIGNQSTERNIQINVLDRK